MSMPILSNKSSAMPALLAIALGMLCWASPPRTHADAAHVRAVEAVDRTLVLFDPLQGVNRDVPPGRKIWGGQDLAFGAGKFGNCVHFVGPQASIGYPSGLLPLRQGTISLWISFDHVPGAFAKHRNIFICPISGWFKNSIQLFVGGSKDWGHGLYYMLCNRHSRRFYLVTSLASWKANQWHHIAVTWRTGVPGESSLALYLDGKLVKKLSSQTILMDRRSPSPNGKTWLWLHGGGSKAGFKIDEFKIYDVARDYSAVGGQAIRQGNNDSAARP